MPGIRPVSHAIPERAAHGLNPGCKSWYKEVQSSVKVQTRGVNPADYVPLPVARDEPCHVCGRRPTSSLRRGGGKKYLCYDCLAKAKRPARVQPLPGVLDHRGFERMETDLGRCDVCDAGKAVYRSAADRTSICAGCYARLVREWNGREGVR